MSRLGPEAFDTRNGNVKLRIGWIGLGLCVLAALGVGVRFLIRDREAGRSEDVTHSAYLQVALGMDLQRATQIIGLPGYDVMRDRKAVDESEADNRDVVDMQKEGDWGHKPDDNKEGRRWVWSGKTGVIAVRLGKDGRITDKMYMKLDSK